MLQGGVGRNDVAEGRLLSCTKENMVRWNFKGFWELWGENFPNRCENKTIDNCLQTIFTKFSGKKTFIHVCLCAWFNINFMLKVLHDVWTEFVFDPSKSFVPLPPHGRRPLYKGYKLQWEVQAKPGRKRDLVHFEIKNVSSHSNLKSMTIFYLEHRWGFWMPQTSGERLSQISYAAATAASHRNS